MKFFPKKKDGVKNELSSNQDEPKDESTKDQKNNVQDNNSLISDSKKGMFGRKKDSTNKQSFDQKPQTSETRTENTEQNAIDNSKAGVVVKTISNPSVTNTLPQQNLQGDAPRVGDEEIRKLMEIASGNKDSLISPTVNFEENLFSYKQLAELGEDDHVQTLLERLSQPPMNVFEKTVSERLVVCPQHPQNFATNLKLCCSTCFSTDILQLHLIEHKLCGFITEKTDSGQSFADMGKCISCKHVIKDPEKEIRRLGRWYVCNSCKVKFDNCVIKLYCREFDHDFEINQASIIPVPAYKLKVSSNTQFYLLSIIPQIKKMITSMGFTVSDSPSVRGKSGIEYKTSIYGHNNANKSVLIEAKSSETIVDDSEINSMLVKVLDISPTASIFIGIPTISDTAKSIAGTQNISIVTGGNLGEILATVEQILKTRFVDRQQTS